MQLRTDLLDFEYDSEEDEEHDFNLPGSHKNIANSSLDFKSLDAVPISPQNNGRPKTQHGGNKMRANALALSREEGVLRDSNNFMSIDSGMDV